MNWNLEEVAKELGLKDMRLPRLAQEVHDKLRGWPDYTPKVEQLKT
jgi:hypothetical protein